MNSNYNYPINIGNPNELTVKQLALTLIKLINTESKSKIIYLPLPSDDPTNRKPDISLAKEIDKCAKKSNRKIDCLIQLKISSEETKFGLDISHLEDFFSEVKKYNNINLVGLMGMASFTQEKEKIIDEFNKIKELYDKMKLKNSNLKILSTGMSDDYKLALENGSNMIRLGSKIFGKRDY